MEIWIAVGLSAVAVVLLIMILAVLLKNKNNESQDNFSENQEDYITNQLEGMSDLVKGYVVDNASQVQDSVARQIDSSNKTMIEVHSLGQDSLRKSLDSFNTNQTASFNSLESKLNENFANIRREVTENLATARKESADAGTEMRTLVDNKLKQMQTEMRESLENMRRDNEDKLNGIKRTVDEQLQDTLNTRLNESFKLIGERLDAVNKGLGEMTNLTNGVNDLNKVLNNVKTRGIWGEVALDNLLSQMLSPELFASQVMIDSKCREAVDFVIYMPGVDRKEKVMLPIDSKFPLADYEKVIEASENCDKEGLFLARKNLIKRIKDEAKSISSKYIILPKTTNFAVMYLPIEGLFAEVVKEVGLIEELQNNYKIVVSGPTTLTALLNSLQIGFKTMQIQEKSADVWKALNEFKQEFGKFNDIIDKMEKKVGEVSKTIQDGKTRTRKISRVLNKIGELDYVADDIEMEEVASDEVEE